MEEEEADSPATGSVASAMGSSGNGTGIGVTTTLPALSDISTGSCGGLQTGAGRVGQVLTDRTGKKKRILSPLGEPDLTLNREPVEKEFFL